MGTSLTTQLVGMIIVLLLCPFASSFIVGGCGADGAITLVFTIFGCYIFGIVHGLYVLIVWYQRCKLRQGGILPPKRAVFIFSERIQQGIPLGRSTAMKDSTVVEPTVVEPTEKSKKKPAAGMATAPVPAATAGDNMV